MPGLTLVSARSSASDPLLEAALQPALQDRHTSSHLWSEESLDIVATHYEGYPLETVETAEYWMCLEGGLYDRSAAQTRSRLRDWADVLLGASSRYFPRSLLNTDGDFLIVAVRKDTHQWAVIPDPMGRLPLYQYTTSSQACLTRDFHLFNRLDTPPAPDRIGAAQQLTFGYPLGRRTLRKDVERVSPGMILFSGPSPSTIRRHRVTEYNFEASRRHTERSLSQNASRLVERLEQSAEARARWRNGPSVLALSGGLDSRSIACGLQRTGCSFGAVTFARPGGRNAPDVRFAQEVASKFGLPHQTVSLPTLSEHHLWALLQIKGGLNPLDVSYMVPYLEAVVDEYGTGAHLLTGNGGALLRDLQPSPPLMDEDDLLHSLLDGGWLPFDTAARLARIAPRDLIDSVRSRLASYPESSLHGQHLHFSFERLFKYSFEGEDRNRSYLWSSAPYHGLHFTRYALNCPDDQKRNYRLYRAFLRALSPRALQIGYANFYGLRMTTLSYNFYRALRWCVRQAPSLKDWLNRQRGRTKSYRSEALVPSLLRSHLDSTNNGILDPTITTRLLDQSSDVSARALDNVLTVTLAFDRPSARHPFFDSQHV